MFNIAKKFTTTFLYYNKQRPESKLNCGNVKVERLAWLVRVVNAQGIFCRGSKRLYKENLRVSKLGLLFYLFETIIHSQGRGLPKVLSLFLIFLFPYEIPL